MRYAKMTDILQKSHKELKMYGGNMITKAIIPVAGWGTRMLPITKSIEKCMLPVGTRPVVDYIVQDIIRAGVKDIYFVVGEQSTQVQSYYRSNIQVERLFAARW